MRLSLALHPATRALIEELRSETGAASMAEAVVDAVRFYHFLLSELKAGRKIKSKGEGGERELALPEAVWLTRAEAPAADG